MDMIVTPARLSGTLDAISSKSFAHRLLVCAALADKPSRVDLNCLSNDIRATAHCLQEMGAGIETRADSLLVMPLHDTERGATYHALRANSHVCSGPHAPSSLSKNVTFTRAPAVLHCRKKRTRCLARIIGRVPAPHRAASAIPQTSVTLDCGESGTTARFMLPLAAHLFDRFTVTGSGRLPGRPFAPLCKALAGAGCVFDGDTLPLTGTGSLRAGDFFIAGDISSQFISGLLFVLPLLDAESRITLTTPLESAAYVDMTIEVLNLFGVRVEKTENGFSVKGNQIYKSPGGVQAEGDWSNAAFFLCMGAMSGDISLRGLSPTSTQGDREVMNILRRFGADISGADTECPVASAGVLRALDIDASQIPDLVPALAVTASAADGTTRIYNAERLRIKESDRIQTTFDMLSALGADVEMKDDGLVIRGKQKLRGGLVDGAGDHRIVMAAAQAACVCENPVVIKGAEAVNKSYPSFFDDFRSLGGIASLEGGAAHVVKSGK